jgi:hypothetical protein
MSGQVAGKMALGQIGKSFGNHPGQNGVSRYIYVVAENLNHLNHQAPTRTYQETTRAYSQPTRLRLSVSRKGSA